MSRAESPEDRAEQPGDPYDDAPQDAQTPGLRAADRVDERGYDWRMRLLMVMMARHDSPWVPVHLLADTLGVPVAGVRRVLVRMGREHLVRRAGASDRLETIAGHHKVYLTIRAELRALELGAVPGHYSSVFNRR